MAVIKSGATSDQLTVDSTSKAARVTLYNTGGVPIDKIDTFLGTCSTFRTLGNAASPQNIFTIENLSGSGKVMRIYSLDVAIETTVALLTVACQIDVSRTTAIPSGGTVLTKTALDTTLTSSANIIFRGATASDGGGATAITATAATGYIARNFIQRQATAVGQVVPAGYTDVLPRLNHLHGFVLRENQAIVVQITGTAASNAATNHYIITANWHEE